MKQKVSRSTLKLVSGFVVFGFLSIAAAAPAPLEFEHSLDLNDFRGSTFLSAMIAKQGIKAALDEDFVQTYEVADSATIEKALRNFDKKIVQRVLGSFDGGKSGLKKFIESIEGEPFTPDSIAGLISKNYRGSGNIYVLAHFVGMASGAGTMIAIDENNYYYNFGYKSGEEADDVKSGRSYGAGPLHNANDASDVMYLNELEKYLQSEESVSEFYKTMLETLTQCDTSGFAELSDLGQTVATDFVAIYTAELDRHVMVDLETSKHPWENDLAEATLLAAYSAASGKLMKEGELVDAPLKDFWAMSSTSNRSGIGITRGDRRKLQRAISEYVRENHGDLAEEIDGVTEGGRDDGDLFRALTEHLNDTDTQRSVKRNAKDITKAFVDLVKVLQSEADKITEAVENAR